ncbi:hypothetical protein AND_009661 [Anopheles darlingi]|uniref:Secreted protein n=1 Tax=Anopheles darlingi TaxID=43151 RepID=W5J7H6_ANODA|nr:hypothetical protein AND_009661 [Anopheles darlingi]
MERSWMKTLAIGLCWLLIVCADGADDQSITVDDIIRSVTAVRAQIGMTLKDRLAQQTAGNRIAAITRPQPPNGRVPGLSILFRGASSRNPTTATLTTNAYLPPLDAGGTSGLTSIPSSPGPESGMVRSDGFSTSTQTAPVHPVESPDPTSSLRANPIGIIFPSQQQLNQFNGQFARPWAGDAGWKLRQSTTTTPRVVDFVFPTDDTDDTDVEEPPPSMRLGVTEQNIRLGTISTTSTPEPAIPGVATEGAASQEPSTPGTTVDTIEEETTDSSEGLGNRIDQKVLLSLVG